MDSFFLFESAAMDTTYYITLNLNTTGGFETFGRFFLEGNKKAAKDMFSLLNGSDALSETTLLHMDLIEEFEGIPLTLKIIYCTLEELASNTKLITREVFKRTHLEV